MEDENIKNQEPKQPEQQPKAKAPMFAKIILAIGLGISILFTFITGRGEATDFFPQLLGGVFMTGLIALILSVLPIALLRKRIKNVNIIVFSICYLLVSIFILIGGLYNEGIIDKI